MKETCVSLGPFFIFIFLVSSRGTLPFQCCVLQKYVGRAASVFLGSTARAVAMWHCYVGTGVWMQHISLSRPLCVRARELRGSDAGGVGAPLH